jgi:3-methyl-2-oxobutanoate hydroxymethyltransferase
VISDVLGLFTDFVPRHAKQYVKLADGISTAVKSYMEEVSSGAFPTEKQSSSMDENLLKDINVR